MKRKLFLLFSLFAIVAIAFTSCQKDSEIIDQKDAVAVTSTSAAGVVPVLHTGGSGGNVACGDLEIEYEFSSDRINYEGGEFDADFPAGFTVTTDGTSVTWSYTPVDGMCLDGVTVIVKGGPAANVYTYEAGTDGDSGLVSPNNASGDPADLSNLTFCFDLIECEEEECWQEETAFGGDTKAMTPGAWWYYFDVDEFETQAIFAGQKEVEDASVNFADGTLTIELGPNMRLQDVEEAVKVQVYAEGQLPNRRPASGLFTTYKGNELVLALDGEFRYIVIHLDVEVKVDCPEGEE